MTSHSSTSNFKFKDDNALISCENLRQNLHCPGLLILDATFFLPRQQRNALQEFALSHIPGSRFFDIDAIADLTSPLPHTLPSAEQFARQIGELGIDNNTWVIVYDNNHFFASARAWWMFRVFGHNKVKILDGGLSRWQKLAFPLVSDVIKPAPITFKAGFNPELFVNLQQMRLIQQQTSKQILDARSEDSFNGQRPLNETDLQPGHMPGSINIPYQKLYTADDQTLLPLTQLQKVFLEAGVDLTKPMLTSCGSGVSAALLLLALYQMGIREVPMFDGSWAEWGRQADLPKHVN